MFVVSVDDDPRAREFAHRSLQQHEYIVKDFETAVEALHYIRDNPADVVLIDFKLRRGPDGLSLANQVRIMQPECVIVMISAYAERDDVIRAMQVGADDFIVKGKISPEQLVQRIGDAILRRRRWYPTLRPAIRHIGHLELDQTSRRAIWHSRLLRLTPIEFDILAHLTSKPGHVFGFAELYSLNTGDHIDPQLSRPRIKTHIKNLRDKLEQNGRYPQTIFSVYGKGFKWDDGGQDASGTINDESESTDAEEGRIDQQ